VKIKAAILNLLKNKVQNIFKSMTFLTLNAELKE